MAAHENTQEPPSGTNQPEETADGADTAGVDGQQSAAYRAAIWENVRPASGLSRSDAPVYPGPSSGVEPGRGDNGRTIEASAEHSPYVISAPLIGGTPAYVPPPPPPPERQSNRGAGTLISVVAMVIFATIYAAVSGMIFSFSVPTQQWLAVSLEFALSPALWVPSLLFGASLIVLTLLANTAGWWAYVFGGFFVAAVTYCAAIVGQLWDMNAFALDLDNLRVLAGSLALDPLTLVAAVIARELVVWFGAWISVRGRRIAKRNAAREAEYQRQLSNQRDTNSNLTASF